MGRLACVRCEVVGSRWLQLAVLHVQVLVRIWPYLAHEGAGVGRAVHCGLGVPHRLPVPLRLRHLVQLSRSTTAFRTRSKGCSTYAYSCPRALLICRLDVHPKRVAR